MLSLLFVLLPLFLTWLALRRWFSSLGLFFTAGLTLLLPIIVLAWMSLLLSISINPDVVITLLVGILLGSTIGLIRQFRPSVVQKTFNNFISSFRRSIASALVSWLYLIGIMSLFGYVLLTHSAQIKSGSWYTGGSSWGDLPLHLTYVNYFSRQDKLSLISPLFTQANITYPFLFDWYTSLIFRMGTSIQTALIVSQWQVLAALVILALVVILKLDKRPRVTAFTLLLFFAGGGLGWWYFWGDWQTAGLPLLDFLQHQPWQFTNMAERSVYFSNVIPDMLLPQRGFIVGLATCLAAISLYIHFASTRTRRYFWLGCVLIGMLPLFHFHSFLWIGGWWILVTIYHGWRQPKQRSVLAKSMILLAVMALPQIWWLFANGVDNHFLRWQLGWMLTEHGWPGLFEFSRLLLLNFGLLLAVLIYLPIQLKRIAQTKPITTSIYGYSWLIFIVCLFISFQPWAYDNLKLMMISYFFLSIYSAVILADWWNRRLKFLVVSIILVATLSGTLSITREIFLSSEIASAHDLRIAQDLRSLLEPGAIALTGSDHNHLVPMLVGQPIVMGYPGWLWSHGIKTGTTATDIVKIYAGSNETVDLLQKYQVRYVYMTNRERAKFAVNENFWQKNYPRIYLNADVAVYDVQSTKN